jgi:hypothetical protein
VRSSTGDLHGAGDTPVLVEQHHHHGGALVILLEQRRKTIGEHAFEVLSQLQCGAAVG